MQTNLMLQNADQWLPGDETWENEKRMRKGSQKVMRTLLATIDLTSRDYKIW